MAPAGFKVQAAEILERRDELLDFGFADQMDVRLSHEHRGYLWLDWDQALETITHDETRGVVRLAQQFVNLHGNQ